MLEDITASRSMQNIYIYSYDIAIFLNAKSSITSIIPIHSTWKYGGIVHQRFFRRNYPPVPREIEHR